MTDDLALLGGVPLHPQPWPSWPIWDHRDEDAVLRALRSGHWGRLTGPEVSAFEEEFALFQECRFGVAVPCGTTALKLALLALDIQAGDEVIRAAVHLCCNGRSGDPVQRGSRFC